MRRGEHLAWAALVPAICCIMEKDLKGWAVYRQIDGVGEQELESGFAVGENPAELTRGNAGILKGCRLEYRWVGSGWGLPWNEILLCHLGSLVYLQSQIAGDGRYLAEANEDTLQRTIESWVSSGFWDDFSDMSMQSNHCSPVPWKTEWKGTTTGSGQ